MKKLSKTITIAALFALVVLAGNFLVASTGIKKSADNNSFLPVGIKYKKFPLHIYAINLTGKKVTLSNVSNWDVYNPPTKGQTICTTNYTELGNGKPIYPSFFSSGLRLDFTTSKGNYLGQVIITSGTVCSWKIDKQPDNNIFAILDPCTKTDGYTNWNNVYIFLRKGLTPSSKQSLSYDETPSPLTIKIQNNSPSTFTTNIGYNDHIKLLDKKIEQTIKPNDYAIYNCIPQYTYCYGRLGIRLKLKNNKNTQNLYDFIWVSTGHYPTVISNLSDTSICFGQSEAVNFDGNTLTITIPADSASANKRTPLYI